MTLKKIKNYILLFVTSIAQPVWALESDRNKPIEIEADQGFLDQGNQVTSFSGNVIIKQGTLDIRADNVRVKKDNDDQQFMNASGRPVKFKQMLDNGKGMVNGQGTNVEYSSKTGVVKLIGNAKVQREGDRAEGAVITYNTQTEVYTVNSSGAGRNNGSKRVTVVLQPQKK